MPQDDIVFEITLVDGKKLILDKPLFLTRADTSRDIAPDPAKDTQNTDVKQFVPIDDFPGTLYVPFANLRCIIRERELHLCSFLDQFGKLRSAFLGKETTSTHEFGKGDKPVTPRKWNAVRGYPRGVNFPQPPDYTSIDLADVQLLEVQDDIHNPFRPKKLASLHFVSKDGVLVGAYEFKTETGIEFKCVDRHGGTFTISSAFFARSGHQGIAPTTDFIVMESSVQPVDAAVSQLEQIRLLGDFVASSINVLESPQVVPVKVRLRSGAVAFGHFLHYTHNGHLLVAGKRDGWFFRMSLADLRTVDIIEVSTEPGAELKTTPVFEPDLIARGATIEVDDSEYPRFVEALRAIGVKLLQFDSHSRHPLQRKGARAEESDLPRTYHVDFRVLKELERCHLTFRVHGQFEIKQIS